MQLSRQQQQPSHDEIARRAYLLWEQRGRPQGREVEFWLEAERQFRSSDQPGKGARAAAAGASATLALQVQHSQLPAKSPSAAQPPASSPAATKTAREVKPQTPRTAAPRIRQTGPATNR